MGAGQFTTETTPCGGMLPELEIPMINSMLACLGAEHKRLDEHILPLALAATRLASSDGHPADQAPLKVWDEIRSYLYSHLQIEDALVFSWGQDHQALSQTLLENLKAERQEMRRLLAAMAAWPSEHPQSQATADRRALAQTLLALARTLDLHVTRHDGEVLPSIRRALFHREQAAFAVSAEP
jgi:iron-sulfur cluster repair protein YtfE (RIC family)